MNLLSNIWNHPKTSIAGLLICVVTVAGVLGGQGISLGAAGTGTVVTLIGALATALLGLLAKDPGSPSSPASGATKALGVVMLCALLVSSLFSTGCSGVSVAQDIVNWTPSLQSAVATVDTTASLLAPADAPIFAAATVGFDAASNLLVSQAKAYLANPSATILAQIQSQIVTFQQQVNASLLAAAKITNAAGQQHALAAIQAVATVVSAMLSLVSSISSKTAVAQMTARSAIKLAQIEPYRTQEDRLEAARLIAEHYRIPVIFGAITANLGEQSLQQSGF